MSDHKVIRIRDWRSRTESEPCAHESFIFMPESRRVVCAQCYADIDHFELLLALAEQLKHFSDEIEDLNTRIDDLC